MSFSFAALKCFKSSNNLLFTQVRHGHRLRGKPPGVARTLAQRLDDFKKEDEELIKRHDIGFPIVKEARSIEITSRLEWIKKQRSDINLEKLAKTNKLLVNLEEVKKDWNTTTGPLQIKNLCDHYGIFKDLFGPYAYFVPRVHMKIKYKSPDTEDEYCPVYFGNHIKPRDTKNAPEVSFEADLLKTQNNNYKHQELYTLIATNPDGHLTEDNKEYVHWMISNIPGENLSKGETVVPYLQPLPYKGTGYHRFVFILYKQKEKLDLSDYKIKESDDLEARTFETFEFYKKYQDFITPAGVSFFQAKYDESVRDAFHVKLKRNQPIFEYDFPVPFINKQRYFPKKQPFNLYLDRYEDPKEVNKRYVIKRLAETHPFNGPKPPLQYPYSHRPPKDMPTWLRVERRKEFFGLGRINDAE